LELIPFYIVSLPENYLSGVFPWPHLDFCDECNHGLNSFQYFTIMWWYIFRPSNPALSHVSDVAVWAAKFAGDTATC
jgi:hypothetical protein